ncbi:hypothetical protein SAMN04488244_12456 [Vibrio hangzhouensis]|uniref:Uncharacterized protein n=1 Tax=Vibrio hangzhouensis TaxID=462991 RepID=A0A1H6BQ77_9VIBR|nr:hypothetical protein SAMN04488244_12456 [Vibrio hangzhouensis]
MNAVVKVTAWFGGLFSYSKSPGGVTLCRMAADNCGFGSYF